MKNRYKVMLIIIFVIISIDVVSAFPERTSQCLYCHEKLGQGFGFISDDEDECGGCHEMKPKVHNPRICKVCHQVKDKDSYHLRHSNVECDNCHEGTQLPDVNFISCTECHDKPIHIIHTNIKNQCSNCHQSNVGTSNVGTSSLDSKNSILSPYSSLDIRSYTIYEVLKTIYGLLKDVQR